MGSELAAPHAVVPRLDIEVSATEVDVRLLHVTQVRDLEVSEPGSEVDREARSLTVATFSSNPYRPKTEGHN